MQISNLLKNHIDGPLKELYKIRNPVNLLNIFDLNHKSVKKSGKMLPFREHNFDY